MKKVKKGKKRVVTKKAHKRSATKRKSFTRKVNGKTIRVKASRVKAARVGRTKAKGKGFGKRKRMASGKIGYA